MHNLALKILGGLLVLGLTMPSLALAQDTKDTKDTKPASPSLSSSSTMPSPGSSPSSISSGSSPSSTSSASPSSPGSSGLTGSSSSLGSMAGSPSTPAVVPGMPPGPGLTPPPTPLNSSPVTPKIVQDAVTGLQKTDPINLDDMVRAQDAINRLDLLLEIEKRQSELKKIRDERNKPTALTTGIPASALNLPRPSVTPAAPPSPPVTAPSRPIVPLPNISKAMGTYTIKRITGSEGRYTAVLDDGSKIVSVRAGESLPDGSKVKTITLTSVSIEKDKKSKTLTIPSDSYVVRGSEAATQ